SGRSDRGRVETACAWSPPVLDSAARATATSAPHTAPATPRARSPEARRAQGGLHQRVRRFPLNRAPDPLQHDEADAPRVRLLVAAHRLERPGPGQALDARRQARRSYRVGDALDLGP